MIRSAAIAGPAVAPSREHCLHFPALDRSIDAREDETLFAAARRAGVRIVGACGGRGTCGSCVVRVADGRVHHIGEGPHRQWLRACRVQPRSDLTVEVAPRSLATIVRADIATGGEAEPLPFDPAVIALPLELPPPTLADQASDVARAKRAIERLKPQWAPKGVDTSAAAELPALARANGWKVSARLAVGAADAPRLIGFAAPDSPLLGLAVDLGTTNVAAFLVDLASGRRLASLGLENPQVAWGADLISRINHAVADAATADALQRAAVTVIDALAHDLARAVGAATTDIVDVAVCGNTAMQHLFAGWPVAQLGRAPFVAAVAEPMELAAARIGLRVAAGATVHVAPSIGGFVGGDHVAALLATEPLWSQPGTSLVMDIGTNTEISLIRDARIWSASCPSGPALEGGHIGCGMRAAEGAIERVAIDGEGRLQVDVIGGGAGVGLCGSGVIDALAAFVGAGWVDSRGRIAAIGDVVAVHDGIRTITLVAETADSPAVRLSQFDVRAVQLAKSAIRTGVALLADEAGIDESRIDRFVVAGAFGAYIGIESAVAIGLLPALPRERFVQVGNAAGLGVQQMLASRERRARAARLAAECRCVELSMRRDFQKTFLNHLGFHRRP